VNKIGWVNQHLETAAANGAYFLIRPLLIEIVVEEVESFLALPTRNCPIWDSWTVRVVPFGTEMCAL